MATAETLDQLATQLEGASQGDINTMPKELYSTIASYLNARVLSLLISVAIIVTILFVFYGAFQYFTAYGDENKAVQAKKSITYAFVGLLISLMAMGIATYVQNLVRGKDAVQKGVQIPYDSK